MADLRSEAWLMASSDAEAKNNSTSPFGRSDRCLSVGAMLLLPAISAGGEVPAIHKAFLGIPIHDRDGGQKVQQPGLGGV
jgi:hypothetical protein